MSKELLKISVEEATLLTEFIKNTLHDLYGEIGYTFKFCNKIERAIRKSTNGRISLPLGFHEQVMLARWVIHYHNFPLRGRQEERYKWLRLEGYLFELIGNSEQLPYPSAVGYKLRLKNYLTNVN